MAYLTSMPWSFLDIYFEGANTPLQSLYKDNGLRHLHWTSRCRRQLEVSQPPYIRQKGHIKPCLGDVITVKFIAYISIKIYLENSIYHSPFISIACVKISWRMLKNLLNYFYLCIVNFVAFLDFYDHKNHILRYFKLKIAENV